MKFNINGKEVEESILFNAVSQAAKQAYDVTANNITDMEYYGPGELRVHFFATDNKGNGHIYVIIIDEDEIIWSHI